MKNTKKLGVVAALVAAGLMTGCASWFNSNPEPTDMATAERNALQSTLAKIDDATVGAVNAQRELVLSADARVRRESNFRKRFLTDRVNYDFYGDVEQILVDIANTYNYTFKKVGPRPVGGVLVNVYAKNMSGVDLLSSVAHADTGQRIDVRLTDSEIVLYYKEPTNTSIQRLTR